MHGSSLLRMQWFVETWLTPLQKPSLKVLDVGSYDVNGSYRQFFPEPDFLYTGLDMAAGPNVDVAVENPYHWSMFDDESFDVIISGQAFEHIEFFWFTLEEMIRVAKKNALFCIIVPRLQRRHRHPTDTYRFDEDGMVALARYGNLKPLHASMNMAPPDRATRSWYNEYIGDAMLVAEKPETWAGMADPRVYKYIPADLQSLHCGFVPFEQYEFLCEKKNVLCPICGTPAAQFRELNGGELRLCPTCSSLERHRVFQNLYVSGAFGQDILAGKKILHLSPRLPEERILSAIPGTEIVPVNLPASGGYAALSDIPDESFDAVFCCFVIGVFSEQDLPLVVAELARILKPGGLLLSHDYYPGGYPETIQTSGLDVYWRFSVTGSARHPREYFEVKLFRAVDVPTKAEQYWLKGIRK